MNKRRVVITGLGVVAPNAMTCTDFISGLSEGHSGIRKIPTLEDLNFSCQIAGKPEYKEDYLNKYFTTLEQRDMKASGIEYGVIAALDAWQDAGFPKTPSDTLLWNTGIIFGTGVSGIDKFREAVYKVDEGKVRRLGSGAVIQTMASSISAILSGKLGCGNIVTTNSAACSTGTEAILMAYDHIVQHKADCILAGSTSDNGPYIWGGFDAMRILPHNYNHNPSEASRPMSASASGFVPGSGAGALIIESLEHAKARSATIYAEILGGHRNSGGHRNGGSMTAPNSEAVQRCIQEALKESNITAQDVDVINGHLTATSKDVLELQNWSTALQRKGKDFPYINSIKSMIGHCLAASGSIESVATVLQLQQGLVFGNRNCEDLHPDIPPMIAPERIPIHTITYPHQISIKASFGFGDVNACIVFKKYE